MKKALLLLILLISCDASEDSYSYAINTLSGTVKKMTLSYRTNGYETVSNEIHNYTRNWRSETYETGDPWIKFTVQFNTSPGKIKVTIYKSGEPWRYDYFEGLTIQGRLP